MRRRSQDGASFVAKLLLRSVRKRPENQLGALGSQHGMHVHHWKETLSPHQPGLRLERGCLNSKPVLDLIMNFVVLKSWD